MTITNPLGVPAHQHPNGGGWVADSAHVDGSAYIGRNARVCGDAWVFGDAQVYGNAWVSGDARVSGNAWVYGDARVCGDAQVYGNAWVSGDARVFGDAWVYGDAWVTGNARVCGNAQVSGDAQVFGDARVSSTRHVLTVGPVGSEDQCVTICRTEAGHHIAVGCWNDPANTIDDLAAEVQRRAPQCAQEYAAVEALCRLRIAEWQAEAIDKGQKL